jgi:uncharacterized protein YecE (DUF72 family)
MNCRENLRVGCAGWTIPREQAGDFGEGPSHLARYATRLRAVEINSTFYQPHRVTTYERWAATVPPGFQFAVKMPREITHTRRLVGVEAEIAAFLSECGVLGPALGPLLAQLPPSLAFDAAVATTFCAAVRARYEGPLVCEPRHASWFTPEAAAALAAYRVARVAADPAVVPDAPRPGAWDGLAYYRLHGSPRTYYSAYDDATLAGLAGALREAATRGPVWCIFDNTAAGAAAANALDLVARLRVG